MDPSQTPPQTRNNQSCNSASPQPTPQWHRDLPDPNHVACPFNNWRSQFGYMAGWTWECIDTLCWCQSDAESCNSKGGTAGCKRNAVAVGDFCDNCKIAGCPILSQSWIDYAKSRQEQIMKVLMQQREVQNLGLGQGQVQESHILQAIRNKAFQQQKEKAEFHRARIEQAKENAANSSAKAANKDDSDSDWASDGNDS